MTSKFRSELFLAKELDIVYHSIIFGKILHTFRHFFANFRMSSDFAEIWYTKVFECAKYDYGVRMLVRKFFREKTYVVCGRSSQKEN